MSAFACCCVCYRYISLVIVQSDVFEQDHHSLTYTNGKRLPPSGLYSAGFTALAGYMCTGHHTPEGFVRVLSMLLARTCPCCCCCCCTRQPHHRTQHTLTPAHPHYQLSFSTAALPLTAAPTLSAKRKLALSLLLLIHSFLWCHCWPFPVDCCSQECAQGAAAGTAGGFADGSDHARE